MNKNTRKFIIIHFTKKSKTYLGFAQKISLLIQIAHRHLFQ